MGAVTGLVGNTVNGITGTVGNGLNDIGLTSLGNDITGAGGSISRALGSSLGPAFGASGGANGTGYASPTAAQITPGTNSGQVGAAYSGAQNSLASQQALLAALQQQQGLRTQSNVLGQQQGLANQQYGVNSVGAQAGALSQQQLLNAQEMGQNGTGNQSLALAQQEQLARQQQGTAAEYQQIASGQGPNPALAALHQQTGQNVANTAALQAGQRGASSNVGLMARQIGQQGAATQQQAVGQEATLQAQQSLNALAGLGAQQQNIGQTQQNVAGIAGQQVGQQQAGATAQQQAASNLVAQQQAQQQALAGQSNVLANQQIGATTTNTQAQQAEQQLLQNALANYNQQNVAMQGNINAGNVGLAQSNIAGQQAVTGGLLNSLGPAASLGLGSLGGLLGGGSGGGAAAGAGVAAAAAEGGEVKAPEKMAKGGTVKPKKMADGGPTSGQIAAPTVQPPQTPQTQQPQIAAVQGPQSSFGQYLAQNPFKQGQQGNQNNQTFNMAQPGSSAYQLQQGVQNFGKGIAQGIQQGVQNYQKNSLPDIPEGEDVDQDVNEAMGNYAAKGGMVKAMLSEGEVNVPKKIIRGKDPIKGTENFVNKSLKSANGGLIKAKDEKEKAVKAGNSYANDKIKKDLPVGNIIIPRSVMQSRDPVRGAADFVAKTMAKRGRK